MLEIAIPNHEAELQQLEAIGLSGYFLGFGLRFGQPDFFMNKYPDAWTKEYETENYFFGDPVAVWTITREGDLPPGRPLFITRVLGVDCGRFRVGQARRARSHPVAQAPGALLRASGCPARNAA